MRGWWLFPAMLLALPVQAEEGLPPREAGAWLQRMADAARRVSYEGEFFFQQGDFSQSLRVVNDASAGGKRSLLTFMDGQFREVRCEGGDSVNITPDGRSTRMVKRISSRHFPDLLPPDPGSLGTWYTVQLGPVDRVANLPCQEVRLLPRDQFRRGYVLCAERHTALPLRVEMINENGESLYKYIFTQVRIGRASPFHSLPRGTVEAEAAAKAEGPEPIQVRQLPPGFNRVATLKRRLPNRPEAVDHWIYSDGLTYISLFLEQARQPVESVKGESRKGMMHLFTRKVGDWQVTVLGDAPWPAVESVAMNLVAGSR